MGDAPEKARLKEIADRLAVLKEDAAKPHSRKRADCQDRRGMALGMRMAVDLVSGVVVGAGMGYVLDLLCGTFPVLFAVFLIFGGAAGVMNAYRASKALENDRQQEKDVKG